MSRCCIAIGGNTGNPELSFTQALVQIEHHGVKVLESSSSILTPAMGSAAGGDFLNAAAVVETSLQASDLLQLLHHVEAGFGRKRSVHWGPRIIDLDLLFYADDVIDSDEVVVPHPCLWYRHFVLEPLSQIASDWIHPTLNESVSQMRARLKERPLRVEIAAAEQGAADVLHTVAQSARNIEEIEITMVDGNSIPSPEVFARLIATSSATRSQPAVEQSRTIRVPLHDGDDVKAVWAEFLQNFATAALG